MRFGLHFGPRVFHRDRQPALAHHRQVNYIVPNERRFRGGDAVLIENLAEGSSLVLNALMHVVHLEVARAQRHRFRNALGDQSRLDARQPRQRNRRAVVRVKALRLNQRCALESETALTGLLGGALHKCVGRARERLRAAGSGKNPDFAVGENAIHIEKDELDFARAKF